MLKKHAPGASNIKPPLWIGKLAHYVQLFVVWVYSFIKIVKTLLRFVHTLNVDLAISLSDAIL